MASVDTSSAFSEFQCQEIAKALDLNSVAVSWLAGDGSDRKYFRLTAKELKNSLVIMQLPQADALALRAGSYDWQELALLLEKQRIPVPKIVKALPDQNLLIIEDLGDKMLEREVIRLYKVSKDFAAIKDYYQDAFQMIGKFLGLTHKTSGVWRQRSFDYQKLTAELDFLALHVLDPLGDRACTSNERKQFTADCQKICLVLKDHSQYFVHRDFHSRNLMVHHGRLAVIDFQDARLGAAAYDLVSLCFDAYVPLELPFRQQLLKMGIRSLANSVSYDVAREVESTWPAVLLQRQLKAIGSFGYLTNKKNKGNYVKYIKPALETLEKEMVFDSRWSFLSYTLIEKLRSIYG